MVDYIVNGGKRLNGEISVYGAKNCALALLGASVLTDDEIILRNCPSIVDVDNMILLLKSIGKTVLRSGSVVRISGGLTTTRIPKNIASLLRGSALILGGSVAKYNEIELPLPGGCAIGARPMDIHLQGLESLGVEVSCTDVVRCNGKPKGASYKLRFASVGATENLVCACVMAKGESFLYNCATEPEVVALEEMLVKMGAKINGVGTPDLQIVGVEKLRGVEFDIIPDRIVAATYLSAAAAAGGNVDVLNCCPKHMDAFLNLLHTRFKVRVFENAIRISSNGQPNDYGKIITAPYPFFPTDMQSLALSLAACSNGGQTVIYEKLFENRLRHNSEELCRMGANIVVEGDKAVIKGRNLNGATVCSRDLRGGAGLVIAALNAEGQSVIKGIQHIDRGYYRLADCLKDLGADIDEK